MPIARMTKLCVLAPRDSREALVDRLQDMGAVQLRDAAAIAREDEQLKALQERFEPETRGLRLTIAKTEFILELLERFEDVKTGLISGFLKEKSHFTRDEFMQVESQFDLEGVYRELEDSDIELRHAEGSIPELEEQLEAMLPWREFDLPLGLAAGSATAELRFIIANAANLIMWAEEMKERCPHATSQEINREKDRVFLAALVHKADLPQFESLASEHGLEQVKFSGKNGTISEEIAGVEKSLSGEKERKERLEATIRGMLPIKPEVCALNDYYNNQLVKEEVKGKLIHTESVMALEGWVEESRIEEIRGYLMSFGQEIDIFFEPPGEDDIPPTQLVNRRRTGSAETIIQLFGLPEHVETDPTPFVAPFFIVFFGMCIGDVGYGIILAIAFWLAMKELDVSKNAKNFFRLFMYCGIATIVAGVITRGYFGIDGESLPGVLKFPGTMDILNNPVPIMLICAALGLIHISIGVGIEMYDNIRNNSLWLGICEQGTTLLFWFGIAVMAVGYGVKFRLMGSAGGYIIGAGVAGGIFFLKKKLERIGGHGRGGGD